ncbi:magnesium transporter [Nisaea sp.]|uniref:magnesium transporter n=1 Tax=Nisaea sp. TaxID=2024842 RepID=UPI003B52CDB0
MAVDSPNGPGTPDEPVASTETRKLSEDSLAAEKARRAKRKQKKLKRRIRHLEQELAVYDSVAASKLYGLTPELERAVAQALSEDNPRQLYRLVRPLHAADHADLIERYSGKARERLVTVLGRYFDPETLTYLDDRVREEVIPLLDEEVLRAAFQKLESDDAVEILGELDEEDQARLLDALPERDRAIVEEGLTYEEESAGRLMQRELVTVPEHWTVGQTIDFLRTNAALPNSFYDIFVVDPARRPLGKLSLSRLLRSKRPVLVEDIMQTDFHQVPVVMDQEDVALLFRQYGLVSAPVVDANDRLLGMITVDDVVDVMNEEAEEDILRLGGVANDDLHGSLFSTTRSRFSWLAVNLVTAVVASGVIGAFETTIEKIVALAVLMPIVASMGGNAGTQTLTVAVRAISMRELSSTNALKFVLKEMTVGSLNGVMFALIAAGVCWAWFGDAKIAAVMASAMVINLFVAGLSGTLIPITLERLKVDPAVASTVFLTTVTDVVGFFTFLGLAALFLM